MFNLLHDLAFVNRETSKVVVRFTFLPRDVGATLDQRKERGIEKRVDVLLVVQSGVGGGCELGDPVLAQIADRLHDPRSLDFYACGGIDNSGPLGTVHKVQVREIVNRHPQAFDRTLR